MTTRRRRQNTDRDTDHRGPTLFEPQTKANNHLRRHRYAAITTPDPSDLSPPSVPSVACSSRSKPPAPPCRGSARLHDQLHRACTQCALVKHRLTLYRTDAAAYRRKGASRSITRCTPGLPDAFLVIRGQFIGIEFKTGHSTPNPTQRETHAVLRANGAQVHIIRTIHEFDHLLTTLLRQSGQPGQ